MNPMPDDERDRLIEDLLEGDISESDFLRLEAEMIVDEEARRAYYDRQKLQTGLALDAEEHHSGKNFEANAVGGRPKRFRFDPLTLAAVATLAVLVGLLGWKIGQDTERARALHDGEPVATGFGVVVDMVDATWDGDEFLRKGDFVGDSTFQLKSGLVAIELFSGVNFFVTGPARFSILSPMEISVDEGEVQSQVPSVAGGFQITLPDSSVVAEASQFIVQATESAESVTMAKGKVVWHFDGDSIDVEGLAAVAKTEDGSLHDGFYDPAIHTEVETQLASARQRRSQEWLEKSAELRNDPRLLLYLSADPSDTSTSLIPDLSPSKNNGTIVRADRAADRWGRPGGALDFSPTGSRIRVNIPGEHESLTLMCWVKIDGLDRWYNSLFLTDGHELHEPHWQIMDDGRLFFSVRALEGVGKRDKHIAYSPPIWSPAQSGQWMHLATTYDGGKKTITHYVNGEAVSIDQIPEEFQPEKVVIGPASVANWGEPKYRTDPGFIMRNLNGAIDEFLVFAAALGAGEVAEIYEAGMP